MSKRFTETLKWDDKWFRSLCPEFKLAWFYVLDKCDAAGVIDLDEELANFQIGSQVDWAAFLEVCDSRLVPISNNKLWISKFVEFQYGEISELCRAHNPVYSSLRKNGLLERVSKGHAKGKKKGEGKDKGEATGDPSAPKYSEDFEAFWSAYPTVRKQKKGDTWKAWQKAIKTADPELLISSAAEYAESPVGSGDYSVMPTTFLNGRMWEDDRASWQRSDHKKTYAQIRDENTDAAGDRFVQKWSQMESMEGLK